MPDLGHQSVAWPSACNTNGARRSASTDLLGSRADGYLRVGEEIHATPTPMASSCHPSAGDDRLESLCNRAAADAANMTERCMCCQTASLCCSHLLRSNAQMKVCRQRAAKFGHPACNFESVVCSQTSSKSRGSNAAMPLRLEVVQRQATTRTPLLPSDACLDYFACLSAQRTFRSGSKAPRLKEVA